MNKELEQNFKALIAYSHTDRFQTLWKDYSDIDYLSQRSKIFLEIFNTFKTKIENPTEEKIKDLTELLTKREFFTSLANKGIAYTIKDVSEILKLKEEVKETVAFPQFNIGAKEYEEFFNLAKESYMESNLYHEKRHTIGADFAKHTFYAHWRLLGEVFNRVLAQEYVASLQDKNPEEIPSIYKHSMSGEKFFSKSYVTEEKYQRRVWM